MRRRFSFPTARRRTPPSACPRPATRPSFNNQSLTKNSSTDEHALPGSRLDLLLTFRKSHHPRQALGLLLLRFVSGLVGVRRRLFVRQTLHALFDRRIVYPRLGGL